MKFLNKLLKTMSIMALIGALFLGNVLSSLTVSAKEDVDDLGTYTIDLSKGSYVLNKDKYGAVIANISVNDDYGRIKAEVIMDGIVEFDINNDGVNDVELKFNSGSEGMSGVFSKCNSCTMTGTYALNCTDYEVFSVQVTKTFYGKVIFKFTDEAPTVNTDTNTTQDTAVTPAQDPAVQEVKETIDESIKIPSLNKPSKTKKSIKISWKKPSKKALKKFDGYEIQCSTDKSFATVDKKTTVKKNKTSATIKKLTPGKKYYVRVRAYKNVNGEKVYSYWSKTKNAKLPKK